MLVGSLFTGIGGIDLGLERAGMTIAVARLDGEDGSVANPAGEREPHEPTGHPPEGQPIIAVAGAGRRTGIRPSAAGARIFGRGPSIVAATVADSHRSGCSDVQGYGSPDSPNPAYGNGDRFVERWEGRTTKRFKRKDDGWPLNKSLCGIPTLYAWSLAYGRNLLTGAESPAGMWRIRNLVAWVRPNPPVGALADKFRPATSYVTIATRARDRWFDLDAVRKPHARDYTDEKRAGDRERDRQGRGRSNGVEGVISDPAGAPPLDWWEIVPGGYSGAHYAVWPPELCQRLIDAMCPRRVCTTCGEPSRRIVETARTNGKDDSQRVKHANGERPAPGRQDRAPEVGWEIDRQTLGWSDCGHETWRPGLVLDPFAGSGTTLMVATGMGRDAIGIDLDERNAHLATERVGMFLDIDDGRTHAEAPR